MASDLDVGAGVADGGLSHGIDSALVREALARILASEDLKSSPQLAGFLRFIVEETLEGRTDEIKGYTIATLALGRDPSFDPQLDPIVRVEATRLRRAIERYYAGPGKDDPVEITIPKGSYIPTFMARSDLPEPVDPEPSRERLDETNDGKFRASITDQPSASNRAIGLLRNWFVPVAALALAALAVAIVSGVFTRNTTLRDTLLTPAVIEVSQPADVVRKPVIIVQPFAKVGDLPTGQINPETLTLRLRDGISRFDEMVVLDTAAASRRQPVDVPGEQQAATSATADRSFISYIITGWVQGLGNDRVTVNVSLLDQSDKRVVWARTFADIQPSTEPGETEAALTREIASTLAQPYGVILSDIRARQLTIGEVQPRFACLLAAFDYWNSYSEPDHLKARSCLNVTVTQDPGFSIAWANLAFLAVEEFRAGYNPELGAPPLDRALAYARKALALSPQSARGLQALMAVYFVRGDIDKAMIAGEAAIRANPYDTDIMADVAARRIAQGDTGNGLPLLRDSNRFNGSPPLWHVFFEFLAAYLDDQPVVARQAAGLLTGDNYALGLVARAIEAGAGNDKAGANGVLAILAKQHPALAADPTAALAKYGFSKAVIERLVSGLMQAERVARS